MPSPESESTTVVFDETKLTLGLPGSKFRPLGGNRVLKANAKRGFQEAIETSVGSSITEQLGSFDKPKLISSGVVMGWPPVRSYGRKTAEMKCKYVKVAVDGAPFLRKIDLEKCSSYEELLRALAKLFVCFPSPICCDYLEECNILKPMKEGDEYLTTYEDKDGDWMLVGDVPWTLFIESCKRLRLMKGSQAIGIAPKYPTEGKEMMHLDDHLFKLLK